MKRSGCQKGGVSGKFRAMKKIHGPGQFRSDGTQPKIQGTMTLEAYRHGVLGDLSSQAITVGIHERLPLMNGQTGCDVQVQLTAQQAAAFAHKLLELVNQMDTVASRHEEGAVAA